MQRRFTAAAPDRLWVADITYVPTWTDFLSLAVDKAVAIALVRENAATELHWGAPLTVQFFVEHHPIAHPYMHLESIRAALGPGE